MVSTAGGRSYLWPFALVTMLFFLWGFAHSFLDVLNKHFQDVLHVSKTQSAYVQAVVYGGYFLMALPAGRIISRFGYRAGVLTGLLLYGTGALLFVPGGELMSFPFFLFSLFVIGCGLTCLETAANPYVTVLGRRDAAERRINFAQSFNGLGWILGPLVGTYFLFGGDGQPDIVRPYAVAGIVVLAVAVVFFRVRLPEVEAAGETGVGTSSSDRASLWSYRHFCFGLFALFLYVAAQTGINSFFINYVTEQAHISTLTAGYLLSFGGMGLFLVGRMGGSYLMSRVRPAVLLAVCACVAAVSMSVLLTGAGTVGIAAFLVCYLCESIMFPTIFAMSIRGVGRHTKRASSFLVMSIVGGAIAPVLMGLIADHVAMRTAFVVPMICFVVIAAFAFWMQRREAVCLPADSASGEDHIGKEPKNSATVNREDSMKPESASVLSRAAQDGLRNGRPRFTPDDIREMAADEVFVFGSNLEGQHGGGAAALAYRKFGATWGVGVGLQGRSYGIPTMHGGVEAIRPYVDEFVQFAARHPELHFYVTRIGCGIAGFRDAEIAPLFAAAVGLSNVSLPLSFARVLGEGSE